MKFLIFSDIHRSAGSFDGGTYEDLEFFEARAKREGGDFIIHGASRGIAGGQNGKFAHFAPGHFIEQQILRHV